MILTISTTGTPERPATDLSVPWLTEGREMGDVLAVATQDRLSRDEPHLMAFVKSAD